MVLDLMQMCSITNNFDRNNKHILHGHGDNNSSAHKHIRTRRSTLKELFERESNNSDNPSSPDSLKNSTMTSSSEAIVMKKVDLYKVLYNDQRTAKRLQDDDDREVKIKTLLETLEFVKMAKHCK